MGLQGDDPRANNLGQWRGKYLLGEELSAVRKAIRDSEYGSVHPASLRRLLNCIVNERTKKYRPRRGRTVNSGRRS